MENNNSWLFFFAQVTFRDLCIFNTRKKSWRAKDEQKNMTWCYGMNEWLKRFVKLFLIFLSSRDCYKAEEHEETSSTRSQLTSSLLASDYWSYAFFFSHLQLLLIFVDHNWNNHTIACPTVKWYQFVFAKDVDTPAQDG